MDSQTPFQPADVSVKYIPEMDYPSEKKALMVQDRTRHIFYPNNGTTTFNSKTNKNIEFTDINHEDLLDLPSACLRFTYQASADNVYLATDFAGLFDRLEIRVGGQRIVTISEDLGLIYAFMKKYQTPQQYIKAQLDLLQMCGESGEGVDINNIVDGKDGVKGSPSLTKFKTAASGEAEALDATTTLTEPATVTKITSTPRSAPEGSLKHIGQNATKLHDVILPLWWLPFIGQMKYYYSTMLLGKISIRLGLSDAKKAHITRGGGDLPDGLNFSLSNFELITDAVKVPPSYYQLLNALKNQGLTIPFPNYHLQNKNLPDATTITPTFNSSHTDITSLYWIFRDQEPNDPISRCATFVNPNYSNARFYVQINGKRYPGPEPVSSIPEVVRELLSAINQFNDNLSGINTTRSIFEENNQEIAALETVEDRPSFILATNTKKYTNGVGDTYLIHKNGVDTQNGSPLITVHVEGLDVALSDMMMTMMVKTCEYLEYDGNAMVHIE